MVVGILGGGILRWGPGGDPGHPPSQASRGRRRLSGAREVEPGEPGVSLLTGKELTPGRFGTYVCSGGRRGFPASHHSPSFVQHTNQRVTRPRCFWPTEVKAGATSICSRVAGSPRDVPPGHSPPGLRKQGSSRGLGIRSKCTHLKCEADLRADRRSGPLAGWNGAGAERAGGAGTGRLQAGSVHGPPRRPLHTVDVSSLNRMGAAALC